MSRLDDAERARRNALLFLAQVLDDAMHVVLRNVVARGAWHERHARSECGPLPSPGDLVEALVELGLEDIPDGEEILGRLDDLDQQEAERDIAEHRRFGGAP